MKINYLQCPECNTKINLGSLVPGIGVKIRIIESKHSKKRFKVYTCYYCGTEIMREVVGD